MKIARLIALSLTLVLGGAALAQAQQGPPGGGRGGMGNPGQMLMQNITLTAEQQARVDSITAKYQAEMKAMRQAGGGGGMTDESRQRMMESRTKLQADLRAVLTDEQQKVFDRNVEEMAARMQRRPPPARQR